MATTIKKLDDKSLLVARSETSQFMAAGASFSKLKLKTSLDFFKVKMNNSFEELGCIGYNPAFEELTAHILIKKADGYGGDLCSNGSYEYVRFYLDYGDGAGWEDMGYVGTNVHNIPTTKDCDGKLEKPINYVVRLKISPKRKICSTPNLPKIKAILSWNHIPQANDPNMALGSYVWGSVKEEVIQISPFKLSFPSLGLSSLLEKAILNPSISLNNIAATNPFGKEALKEIKDAIQLPKIEFTQLVADYNKAGAKVEITRSGHKLIQEALSANNKSVVDNISSMFALNKFSLVESINLYNALKCNTSYEELFCVGLDYNKEALVGTLKVKKPYGYSGSLCNAGSKEYVSFWIQEEGSCKWKHAGTTFVNVHDVQTIPSQGLSYSVILPYNLSQLKNKCSAPSVLKVRAILSWNTAPTGMNCSQWGNVIESYIQIPPIAKNWDGKSPKLITVGGVSTDNIDSVTGLTLAGAKIEFNQTPTNTGSPFGGIIVVQGVSAPLAGMKYRVKITNLNTSGSYYLNDALALLGYNPVNGNVVHPVIGADANNYYTYQTYENNIESILARFTPGTNDRILVTIEHENGLTDSQIIQMDNTFPEVTLSINDNGNCSHYKKGDIIKGVFTVNDNYLLSYALSTNVGTYVKVGPGALNQSGTTNGTGNFEITTFTNINCGSISLIAYQKTIWNSVTTGTYTHTSKIICLAK